MPVKITNISTLSPSEEILSQLDANTDAPQDGIIKNTKKKLAQVTTAVALGSVLTGTPVIAGYNGTDKQVASNEVMLVEETGGMTEERFLATAGLREKDIEEFNKLGPSEKQAIFDYYTLGINKGLDSKKLRGLAIQLTSYFGTLKNYLDYINGKILPEQLEVGVLEANGSNIDKFIGTNLSAEGKNVEAMLHKYMNDEIRKSNDEIRKSNDEIRKSNDEIRKSNDLIEALRTLIGTIKKIK